MMETVKNLRNYSLLGMPSKMAFMKKQIGTFISQGRPFLYLFDL